MKRLLIAITATLVAVCVQAADTPQQKNASKPRVAKQAPSEGANDVQNKGKQKNDELVLDPTVVSGNRELPKVMYIVPWKKADLGNLPGQPFNSLLDEALAPVDRDVFRREVQYYQVIAGKDRGAAERATPNADSK